MPCDYSEYPLNWLTFYRPYCLRRAGERIEPLQSACQEARCEWCKAINHHRPVVLTIAHLDHDHTNPMPSLQRLAALCQRCHNNYDAPSRRSRREAKLDRTRGQLSLLPIKEIHQ